MDTTREPSSATTATQPAGEDEVLAARRELSELTRELSAVQAENDALVKAIGPRAAAVRKSPRAPSVEGPSSRGAPSSGYREPDREAVLTRALAEVQAALASERVDNAILRSMRESRHRTARLNLTAAGAMVGVVLLLVGLVTNSLDVLLAPVLVCALFAAVLALIPPLEDRSGGEGPPELPPSTGSRGRGGDGGRGQSR